MSPASHVFTLAMLVYKNRPSSRLRFSLMCRAVFARLFSSSLEFRLSWHLPPKEQLIVAAPACALSRILSLLRFSTPATSSIPLTINICVDESIRGKSASASESVKFLYRQGLGPTFAMTVLLSV